uniref:Cytochrome P450 n=1 Tax=Phlebotomus papatasi TaxID=29031 RepID=A0A1B0D3B1_PHLPP
MKYMDMVVSEVLRLWPPALFSDRMKTILYQLILNFKIEPNEKTQIPLKLSKHPLVVSEKGIWVQFRPRKTKEN